MSKIKILETNKNLYDSAKAMFDKVLAMQTDADRQMKEMREVESKVQSIEKSNLLKEEQRKRKEEEEKRLEQQRREQEAEALKQEASKPKPKEAPAVPEPPADEAVKTPEPKPETKPSEPAKEEAKAPPEESRRLPVKDEEVKVPEKSIEREQPEEEKSKLPESPEVEKKVPAEPKPEKKAPQKKKPAAEKKIPAEKKAPAEKKVPAEKKTSAEKKAPAERKPGTQKAAERKPASDRKQEGSSRRAPAAGSRPAASARPDASSGSSTRPGDHNQNRRRKEDTDRKKKKPVIKERVFSVDEEDFPKGSRKRPNKKAPKRRPIEPIHIDHAVITEDTVSVKLLSEKIGKPVAEILKKLLLLGMMSTINSQIDFDTAQLVASEFGVELEQKLEKTAEEILVEETEDTADSLEKRPPVVTIMGHVDHGKTSLLDKIRVSHITEQEAGGITQHIGAYQVELNDEKITFIDTPGHEAFTAMRARGAQVTDIAIIVVAADDGIMPQTIEAINHAKSADVPIVVAVNKIDRENANVSKIMQELTEYDLVPEDWGGDTIVVPVSAKTGEGIDRLLEMVLLVAEMQELKANPHRLAKGTIIEAQLDKGRGPVATVLVQNGTLKTGDTIIAGVAFGRVRAMVDDLGRSVKEALPSQPVEVIGFSEVPVAGDLLHAAEGALSRKVAEERKDQQKAEMLKKVAQVSLDDLFSQIAEGQIKELNIVIKADVQGSVEAVKQSLEKLSNEEVRVKAIHTGVGAITETDVMLASAANAIIIGFNVRPDNMAVAAAEREKVDIRLYRVIYKAIEDIENAMHGLLEPEFEEVITGHAEVRQTFKVSSVGTVAGCYVTDGDIHRNSKIRLYRDNVLVHEGALSSLKRYKDDVREVSQGYECGLTIENYNDIKEGDVVECFEMQQIER